MIEPDARIPDRVPDAVCHRLDVTRPAVVQQHEVEVAARRRFASAVAADRDQRDSRRIAHPLDKPVVRHFDQGGAQRRTDQ
jgi:hypothetical protein